MTILRFDDPPRMPATAESPAERLARALPLAGTPGQVYVERRGIALELADAAGVRFDPDFGGRPAVLVAMRDREDQLRSVHGRYLSTRRRENKMLTVGPGGGAVSVLGGWRMDPLILVEGLFDALSLAVSGFASVATIGRVAPWLPDLSVDRDVWIAFDAGKPGEAEAARYVERLRGARGLRLPPPPRCKDWNTALAKRGPELVSRWIQDALEARGATRP
jgi:hypothetical protein